VKIRHRLFTIRRCGAVPVLGQIPSVDVHVHVRTLPTIGTGFRAVQIPADQFREPVRRALRCRPSIRASIGCWGWHRQIRQRRQQHFTGQGIEIAAAPPPDR
jgi:hypothetical protein